MPYQLSTLRQEMSDQLASAPGCQISFMARESVIAVERGPSGGPEILATVYLDDPTWGFWYGHVLPNPDAPGRFIALLVWSTKFLNGQNEALVLRRLHHWVVRRQEYHPVTIQHPDDAYAEVGSLVQAVGSLKTMLHRFDLEKRMGLEGSPFEADPIENRIFQVYGLSESVDRNGILPPLPMPPNLTAVTGEC